MRPSSSSVLRLIAPDILEAREGGGCLSLFGLPFLLAGLFVFSIALRIIPVQNPAELPAWAWPLIGLVGLVFVTVGGALVFGRRWIRLDLRRGQLELRTGLLVPLRTRTRPLAGFDAVALRYHSGDEGAASYPVALRATDGGPDQIVFRSSTFAESRAAASQVVRFLGLPLVDTSTGSEVILSAERADASLQQRMGEDEAREAAAFSAHPAAPLRMRSQVREPGRIVIPGPGFKPSLLLGLIVPLVILAFVVPSMLGFFDRTHTPPPMQKGFIGFLVFGFGLLPVLSAVRRLVAAARARTVVSVTPEALTIEERGAWSTRVTRIATADILDLDLGTTGAAQAAARREAMQKIAESASSVSAANRERAVRWATRIAGWAKAKGITIKTREGLYTVGAGLPDEELAYVHAVIREALLGPAASQARW